MTRPRQPTRRDLLINSLSLSLSGYRWKIFIPIPFSVEFFFFKFLAVQFFHFEGKNSIRYSFRRYYSSNFRGKILIVLTPRVDLFLLFFQFLANELKFRKSEHGVGNVARGLRTALRNFYRRITIIRRFNDLDKPRNRKERQASGRMSRESP